MIDQCAICTHIKNLYPLTIPAEPDFNVDEHTRFVCGKCWETIVGVSRLWAVQEIERLEKRIAGLEALHLATHYDPPTLEELLYEEPVDTGVPIDDPVTDDPVHY